MRKVIAFVAVALFCSSGLALAVSAGKTLEFKGSPQGTVKFDGTAHKKAAASCKECHTDGMFPAMKQGTVKITMAQIYAGKLCGACHNGKKAFTVAGNCGNCHKGMKPREIQFKIKGIEPVTFSHEFHTAAYSCKDCHTRVFPFKAGTKHYTMASMETGKSCGACHNGKEAFTVAGDCAKCHKGFKPGNVVFKTESGDAKFSHQFHLEIYKCADCHTKLFAYKAGAKHFTMHEMEKGNSCGACHNGKDAFTASGDCEKCHTM